MTRTRAGTWWSAVLLACILWGSAVALQAASSPTFTPQAGFGGSSHGNGTLRLLFGRQKHFQVDSRGVEEPDGTFRLEQTVTFEGKLPKQRTWRIRTTASGDYAATLSDAAGPVTGHTEGATLYLRYRIKGPLMMHQTLRLMPDGRTIDNVGRITLLAIPVGRLHETILRAD